MEIGSLLEKEFRITLGKMVQDLRKKAENERNIYQ